MPSPLEEELKLSPYILNVMLYGANRPFNVALVVVDEKAIRKWATDTATTVGADLATDPAVRRLIGAELARCGASFKRFEQPADFVLAIEDFTIESGLLTPTLKLKRAAVLNRYKDRLERLYERRKRCSKRMICSTVGRNACHSRSNEADDAGSSRRD